MSFRTPSTSSFATDLTLATFARDPYPVYTELRAHDPVAWVPALNMYLVTRYADVRATLLNADDFVVGTDASLLFATFGEHMLTTEGARHEHYRDVGTRGAFAATSIRARCSTGIRARVSQLVDDLEADGRAELRSAFAARLPIQVMLDLFGLPAVDEALFRQWYNSFEAALANHGRDAAVARVAAENVAAFHVHFQTRIDEVRSRSDEPSGSLLTDWLSRPADVRLTDDEIRRNALIVFFGGISTVEALILNTLWALFNHQDVLRRVRADPALMGAVVNESMRWQAPVQSATRHARVDTQIAGVAIPRGATVNCMVASANRDESVFADADRFDIERRNVSHHLGFATGRHHCLGRHLAHAEAVAAIATLLNRLPELRLVEDVAPFGHEFRQPPSMQVEWRK